MTRERVKELLPVMQAFAEGKTIQFYSEAFSKWEDINTDILLSSNIQYRVKPANEWYQKLANQFHWWIAKDKNGEVYAYRKKPYKAKDPYDFYAVGSGDDDDDDDGTENYIYLSKKMFPGIPKFEGEWDKTLIEPEEK